MFNFFKDISQGRLIGRVNKHLKKSKISLELNAAGICNGLVFLAIEYFLMNKKDEFFKDLEKLIQKPDEALAMIARLMIFYNPEDFFLDFSQKQSYQLFSTSKKDEPIKPSFVFGAVMTDSKWISFFKELNLREDEIVAITSFNHIVYITRKGKEYELYDPNQRLGVITKESEKSLVSALQEALLFGKIMGMSIQVFQQGDGPKPLRDKTSFHKLVDNQLGTKFNDKSYDSFDLSIFIDDPDYLAYCPEKITVDTLKRAIVFKSDKIVDKLLTTYVYNYDLNECFVKEIIYFSLLCGSYKIFNDLLKKKEFKTIMDKMEGESIVLLTSAISGQHPELFDQVLDLCKDTVSKDLTLLANNGLRRATNLLIHALNNKQHQITSSLIKFYKDNQIDFDDYNRERLLIAALRTNDLTNLVKIIESYPPKNFQRLRLDIFAVYELSPELIHELKLKGVSLTFWQECCLQSKDSTFLSIIFCLAMYLMYAYRWVQNRLKQPMKSIYFENPPIDPSEEHERAQLLAKQIANLEDMAQVFKIKKPEPRQEGDAKQPDDESTPLLSSNGPHPS